MFGDIRGQADVHAVVGQGQRHPGCAQVCRAGVLNAAVSLGGCVHLAGIGFDADVPCSGIGECGREVARSPADVQHRVAPQFGAFRLLP
ncbi:Uncharacterised protein [Mycobacteroides abscessus subsp. abscessus]|nr:Uncharacterised protein [Mycobacteroides abscessus]SHV96576.1 Uncharacterised protein [Mycobacteroides abscessus subsp. abscessus]SIN33792.1 Uncharacterised protein [Mycobacteroides abscessus subsp. abscessus]